MTVTLDDLVATVRREGERIAAMPVDALAARVPAVPDWTLEDVVRHTGAVHRRVLATLDAAAADPTAERPGPQPLLPPGPQCLVAYREVLDAMLARFAAADPDRPAPSFVGLATVGWWIRRQAHEVTVHRFDAADAVHAAGGPEPAPADAACAADGIDELTDVMFPSRLPPLPESLHGSTIHLHGTDTADAEWLLEFGADGVVASRAHAKADVALRGPAQSLLLVLWRRRPLDVLEVFGDASIAERFLDITRF
ncbi:MAG TPA: maleylpyruvate isomerase N-terminal domain-containing protein [Aldersonia sp.]